MPHGTQEVGTRQGDKETWRGARALPGKASGLICAGEGRATRAGPRARRTPQRAGAGPPRRPSLPRPGPLPARGPGLPPLPTRPGAARSPRGAMASRLLHRLRHALAGDSPGEAAAGPEAEQFPESSELGDDDAEGLSSRLSGTLSFTSAEDEDDEGDEVVAPDPLSPGDGASGEDAGECGRSAARSPGQD